MNDEIVTRSEILGEELYALTLAAKNLRVRWVWQRYRYAKLLSQMQYLLHAIAMDYITDNRTDALLRAVTPRTAEFERRLRSAEIRSMLTEPQKDLLLTMQGIVSVCVPVLLYKQGEYVGTLRCSVGALHNLARAFLPQTDYMHLSVEDAMENARPYWKRFG